MSDMDTRTLHLLLFSVGGICFGVDAGQVAEMTAYNGESDVDLFWFHEEMGYADKAVRYQSPIIATIKAGMGSQYRVVIDSMEDIAEFSQSDISPFPSMLEQFVLRRGCWGILLRQKQMIVLLDFRRLLRERSSE